MAQHASLPTSLNIGATERETGLSKDVLRIWERRYGFPLPVRDENAERQYAADQVAKLRAIKRLMDTGMRPGKLIGRSLDELNVLAASRVEPRREAPAPVAERDVLALLRQHDIPALQRTLATLIMRDGLRNFVLDTAVPLNKAVGEAWLAGELQVFQEHLYTEQLTVALRTAIHAFPRFEGSPRMLMTTFPGEQHGLGLLLVEALLAPEGVHCLSLGVQTPVDDIARAAVAHKADIVALSFSSIFSLRQAGDGLAALRRHLPGSIAIWAGGELTRRLHKALPGVDLIADLPGALTALEGWRSRDA